MFIVIAQMQVRPGRLDEFTAAARANSAASLRDEPGCLRFDVLSVEGAPSQVVLYEIYADEQAYAEGHRGSPHYAQWRAAIADLLTDEGVRVTRCVPLFEGSVGK